MTFYSAYLLTISCFGILRHVKLCRDIIYQFVNPVHRCVYAHLTKIYECSFGHFFSSVNTQTCVLYKYLGVFVLLLSHSCALGANTSMWLHIQWDAPIKASGQGRKHKEGEAVPWCTAGWALGLCHGWIALLPQGVLPNTAGSAPATATDLHSASDPAGQKLIFREKMPERS